MTKLTRCTGILMVTALAGLAGGDRLAHGQAAPDKVLGSAQYSSDPDLRCDLLEVRRVSGGAMMIRWRTVNTTASGGGLAGSTGKTIRYAWDWPELYFIDPAENKKYQFLTDSANNRIVDVFSGDLPAGQQRLSWARFPAPPPSSTKITFGIPKCSPPLEDIPISQ